MKQFSAFLNGVLASALVGILLASVLPNAGARAAATPEPTPAAAPACDSSRSIHVSGTAVVNIVPDRVLIQLGVQSNGLTPQRVEDVNTATINRVIGAIESLGVKAEDIATDWYVIEPLYEDYDSLHIKGYRIYNIVAVTLREIEKVNKVIANALAAGANQVVDVEFYTAQLRKYRDQARDLAVKAAAEKARDLAAAAGAETGCVLSINENTWSYFNSGWWYGRNQNLWTQNVVQNVPSGSGEGALSEAGPISLGMISVRAEVSVTYGLAGH
jgi:uncharacterized protein YggE